MTSPEVQAAATILLSAIATYLFPANAGSMSSATQEPADPKTQRWQ
jgi:hypothetical protein